jgi:hypothetical protein
MTMTEQEPTESTNLDREGNPTIPWSRPRDLLATGVKGPMVGFFLGTVRPDGRPHAAGVGAVFADGDLYFTSGYGTQKSRNLAANPACTISVKLAGLDLTLDGTAEVTTDRDVLARVVAIYRDEAGWPAEVAGEAVTAPFSAPTAGPPPWHLYRFRFHTALGLATAEPSGVTRWRWTR